MSSEASAGATSRPRTPQVQSITYDDIAKSLREGLRDFQAAPLYGLFFGAVYAGFGWFILYLIFMLGIGSYAYPMITGFALVVPFAAAGLYEVSRRLEKGEPLSWGAIQGCIFGRGRQGGGDHGHRHHVFLHYLARHCRGILRDVFRNEAAALPGAA